jgi:uncharacterized protein (TIGR02145 family)
MLLMTRIFKILPLLGIMSCSDFPEIAYEERIDKNSLTGCNVHASKAWIPKSVNPRTYQAEAEDGEIVWGEVFRDGREDSEKYLNTEEYKTVVIGNQTWMARNLNFKVPLFDTRCYDGKESNCSKYGVLYDWEAAMVACPRGWHLPNDADWDELVAYAGGPYLAGKKLKSKNGWADDLNGLDGNGSDTYGFNALPGGVCDPESYSNEKHMGAWWSSTAKDEKTAFSRLMFYMDFNFYGNLIFKDGVRKAEDSKLSMYISVRCIKD